MRILVCGDRNWTSKTAIERELKKLPEGSVIIEGEARGADTLGRIVAEELGFEVEKYPADWKRYGRSAGPIRNKRMLTKGRPDLVIAFHPCLETSKGTVNMIRQANRAKVNVLWIKG